MNNKEFIKKWNVAFEDKEQEVEFARGMLYDLNSLNIELMLKLKRLELRMEVIRINSK